VEELVLQDMSVIEMIQLDILKKYNYFWKQFELFNNLLELKKIKYLLIQTFLSYIIFKFLLFFNELFL
jgi:hypothetical protein